MLKNSILISNYFPYEYDSVVDEWPQPALCPRHLHQPCQPRLLLPRPPPEGGVHLRGGGGDPPAELTHGGQANAVGAQAGGVAT